MSPTRRPIDDPEVRQQHRSQVRSRLFTCTRAPLVVALVLFSILALTKSYYAAFGDRVPASVTAVDAAHDKVTVASGDPEAAGTYDVADTDAYAVGDHVGVILTGEDSTPTDLDREPVWPRVLLMAVAFGALAAIVIAARMICTVWRGHRRHRTLSRPWRRVRVRLFSVQELRLAYVPDHDDRTFWRLTDFPADLPMSGVFETQIAGTSRRLVVRFFGSTQLVTARRRRARRNWIRCVDQPTGESEMSEPRCMSVGVSEPRSSSSRFASRK